MAYNLDLFYYVTLQTLQSWFIKCQPHLVLSFNAEDISLLIIYVWI